MIRARPLRAAAPWLPALLVVLAGCVAVTINVTFPQEKIDSAASSIEDLVRMPSDAPPGPAAPAAPRSEVTPRTRYWFAWMGPVTAEAQAVPELRTRTPEIMAVIESRRARWPRLEAALARGCLGETSTGLVTPRPGQDCPPDTGALAQAENADRMTLYRTLLEQNNMPAGDLPRVQAGFAKANRERVPGGAWIQDDAGQWRRK